MFFFLLILYTILTTFLQGRQYCLINKDRIMGHRMADKLEDGKGTYGNSFQEIHLVEKNIYKRGDCLI